METVLEALWSVLEFMSKLEVCCSGRVASIIPNVAWSVEKKFCMEGYVPCVLSFAGKLNSQIQDDPKCPPP